MNILQTHDFVDVLLFSKCQAEISVMVGFNVTEVISLIKRIPNEYLSPP
jgi:hypothetical protein